MTISRSSLGKLRARVLFYWATSRDSPTVRIPADGLSRLLELDGWCSAGTEEEDTLKHLREIVDVEVEASGGLRIVLNSSDAIGEVFEYWRQTTGKQRSRLTSARRTKISARLRDGYTVGQLKSAVDGLMASPWHRGENPNRTKYLGINVVFRDGDFVERFMSVGQVNADLEDDDVKSIRSEWQKKRRT